MKFSEYVKKHTELWNKAQEFDSKFNIIILSQFNFNFRFKILCSPAMFSITSQNNSSLEGWYGVDLKFLPADILCEYAEINKKLQEWKKENISFPF